MKKSDLKPLYRPDDVLEYEEEDQLHHLEIVDVLQHALVRSEGSINIALYGGWGVGKSTIINFLKNRIKKDKDLGKKFQLIVIDAWKLSPEILRQELLEELAKQLGFKDSEIEKIHDELYNIKHISENLPLTKKEKIIEILTARLVPIYALLAIFIGLNSWGQYIGENYLTESILGSILLPIVIASWQYASQIKKSVGISTKRIIHKTESSHQFEKLFDYMVSKKQKPRLVIAFDNLDRCDEKSAVKILSSIKTFMGNKDCIYVIPCDENALINHLKREYDPIDEKQPKEFLRKFFQITIHVPPQIKGDLESYVKGELEKFSEIPFDNYVNEVLIFGTEKNPRKLRQYIYNLAISYKLAEFREKNKILLPGVVTSKTGFLAKIIVIKEEWPKIYKKIASQATLLTSFDKSLSGTLRYFGTEFENEIKKTLNENPEFVQFLRATSLVSVDDIRPFLRLSQESYESLSPELEQLSKSARENNVDQVKLALENLEPEDRYIRVDGIIALIEHYINTNNFQFAFNVMNVLLELYETFSDNIKLEIISQFSAYILSTQSIRDSLHRFDPAKLFPIVMQMNENVRTNLLKEYCSTLSKHTPIIESLLDQFILNASSLPQDIKQTFDYELGVLGNQSPDELPKILQIISKSEEAKSNLVGSEALNSLIDRISNELNPETKEKIQLYLKLKSRANDKVKNKFMSKILSILPPKSPPQVDKNTEYVLETLSTLEKEDVTQSGIIQMKNQLVTCENAAQGHDQKLKFLKPMVKHMQSLSNDQLEKFITEQLVPVTGWPIGIVNSFVETLESVKPNLLENEQLLNPLIGRIKAEVSPPLMEYLLKKSQGEGEQKVLNAFTEIFANGNEPILTNAFVSFTNMLDYVSTSLDEIVVRMLKRIKKFPPDDQIKYYNYIIEIFPKASGESKTEIIELLKNLIKRGEPQRSNSITYLKSIWDHIEPDTQKEIISQLTNSLINGGNLEQRFEKTLEFIFSKQVSLKDEDLNKLIDFFNSQIEPSIPNISKQIALESFLKFDNLNGKDSEVVEKVGNLTNSGEKKIQELAKQVNLKFSSN